jgi:hypothetical protein
VQNRKQTAWKKNRRFGDVKGGRRNPKISDNIFRRLHSLKAPPPGAETPVVMEENPSRDYFFPLSGDQFRQALDALPNKHTRGLTHLWLRRGLSGSRQSNQPLAEFICGSGVRVIILSPWRRDMRLCLGRDKVENRIAKSYARYGAPPFRHRGWWYVEFSPQDLRRFYVQHLLYHEVGHHVDWYYRHWTAANLKQAEDAADQYAFRRARTASHVIRRFEEDGIGGGEA